MERQAWAPDGSRAINRTAVILQAEADARKNGDVTLVHDHHYGRACRGNCYTVGYEGEEIKLQITKHGLYVDISPVEKHIHTMKEVFDALVETYEYSNELVSADGEKGDFKEAMQAALTELGNLQEVVRAAGQ